MWSCKHMKYLRASLASNWLAINLLKVGTTRTDPRLEQSRIIWMLNMTLPAPKIVPNKNLPGFENDQIGARDPINPGECINFKNYNYLIAQSICSANQPAFPTKCLQFRSFCRSSSARWSLRGEKNWNSFLTDEMRSIIILTWFVISSLVIRWGQNLLF